MAAPIVAIFERDLFPALSDISMVILQWRSDYDIIDSVSLILLGFFFRSCALTAAE
jgi:hypothetical protein